MSGTKLKQQILQQLDNINDEQKKLAMLYYGDGFHSLQEWISAQASPAVTVASNINTFDNESREYPGIVDPQINDMIAMRMDFLQLGKDMCEVMLRHESAS